MIAEMMFSILFKQYVCFFLVELLTVFQKVFFIPMQLNNLA